MVTYKIHDFIAFKNKSLYNVNNLTGVKLWNQSECLFKKSKMVALKKCGKSLNGCFPMEKDIKKK